MVTHCTGEDGREEGGRAGPGPQALVGEQGAKPPPGGLGGGGAPPTQ